MQSSRSPVAAALAIARTLAWLALLGLTAAMSVEILLQYRVVLKRAYPPSTVIGDLDLRYDPFSVQYLHPQYLYFFPLDPAARVALGNAVVSVDRDGFREPGPVHANGRKLAVMLGGSAVFGHYSSSNDTTITSYLNRLQDEFFFVNAGVPSWNSTQELIRLSFQIADLKPAMVITFDGANDAELAVLYSPSTGLAYPPGTPESFDDLERWVDDIRSGRWLLRPPRLFPELRLRLEQRLGMEEEDEKRPPASGDPVAAAVRQYLSNQQRMAVITGALGARFISVFQPVASLHRNVPEDFREEDAPSIRFHRLIAAAPPDGYEFHDLSGFFDSQLTAIPAGEPAGGEPSIFVDDVHLFDRGNELVAKRLLEIVRAPPARQAATPTPSPPTTTAPAPSSARRPRAQRSVPATTRGS